MELPTDQVTIIDYAQAVSLPYSRSSTPQVAYCCFLQLCNADIRKYTIMHNGVTHTLNSLAPNMEEEDPEMQELIQSHTYLKERLDAAESVDEFISPISRQTVKKPLIEIPKFNLETPNKCASLKETTDVTGTSNTSENNPQIKNDDTNKPTPNKLPPPGLLKIENISWST
ncbi:hypothetical protein TNCV_1637651 [Trichonephila clavipes]|nr:hypothetical protein TNCV_1637651 [Trichonephila clavipes]